MALAPSSLSSSLASDWLMSDGSSQPASASESGDRFAGAVSGWFAGAMAGPYPCATATARRSQLASAAASAIADGSAAGAANSLALALTSYMAGQVFGPGVASPPAAAAAASSAIGAAFANVDLPTSARADQIAAGVQAMAASTIVIFPPPLLTPPAPVS